MPEPKIPSPADMLITKVSAVALRPFKRVTAIGRKSGNPSALLVWADDPRASSYWLGFILVLAIVIAVAIAIAIARMTLLQLRKDNTENAALSRAKPREG